MPDMFCTRCGEKIVRGTKKCNVCGLSLIDMDLGRIYLQPEKNNKLNFSFSSDSTKCWDCYYSEADTVSNKWICKKKKRKVEGDAPACTGFVTEDAKSCLDCYYSEAKVGGLFNRQGDYYCTAKNKNIHMDDLACSRFME